MRAMAASKEFEFTNVDMTAMLSMTLSGTQVTFAANALQMQPKDIPAHILVRWLSSCCAQTVTLAKDVTGHQISVTTPVH